MNCNSFLARAASRTLAAFSVTTFALALSSFSSAVAQPPQPASPPSNPVLWLRADAGVTQTNGLVSQWADQSGSGNAVTGSNGRVPLWLASGINNLPTLSFDGLNGFLSVASSSTLTTSAFGAKTIAIVFKTGPDITNRQILWAQGNTTDGLNIYVSGGQIYIGAWSFGNNWTPRFVNFSASTNTAYKVKLVLNSANGTLKGYRNGSLQGTANGIGTLAATPNLGASIGRSSSTTIFNDGSWPVLGTGNLYGNLSELLIYNSALNDTDQQNLDSYLSNKYGLPTPSSTPGPTPTPSPTATPSPNPTATPTPSPTATPVPNPTATPVPNPTATPTPAPNPTPTPTPSGTPTTNLQNGSFESPALASGGFTYGGDWWSFVGSSGTQRNGSTWSPSSTAPEGVQTAFLFNGGVVSQNVTWSAGTYQVTFKAARRYSGDVQPIQLKVGSTNIGTAFTPGSTSFSSFTSNSFTVPAGSHVLSFTASSATNTTALLDDVKIVPVGAPTPTPTATPVPTATPSPTATPVPNPTATPTPAPNPTPTPTPSGTPTTNLQNGSFESPALAAGGFSYGGDWWNFAGSSGTQRNGSTWSPSSTAPEGVQTAFFRNGAVISQSFSWSAGTYQIKFYAARRYSGDVQSIQVAVNGQNIGSAVTPAGTNFTQFTSNSFTVPGGNHTLSFTATVATNDTALLDHVQIVAAGAPAPTPTPTPAPNPTPTPTPTPGGTPVVGMTNGSFESPALAAGGFSYGGDWWNFVGSSGTQRNGSTWSPSSTAPEGVQTAFLFNGGVVSQTFSWAAGTYQVKFHAARRYPGDVQPIQLQIDGVNVGTPFTPADTSFSVYTSPSFTVTAGNHTLSLVATSATNTTTLVDNVRIVFPGMARGLDIAPTKPLGRWAMTPRSHPRWLNGFRLSSNADAQRKPLLHPPGLG